jgi:ABC-type branched-subunit amino acid transport system substrate-binding protein
MSAPGAAHEATGEPARLGLLYSLSGGLSITETSIRRGALVAIDEVNAAGGIRGRPLVEITEDYASDLTLAGPRARRLLQEEGVFACVGGYTSASRAAMAPMFRAADSLLLFPTYYEGLETDEHLFYAGAVPNQFLVDYVDWILYTLGTRIYMVGSDYVYPRTAGAMISTMVRRRGGVIAADRYVPLATLDFTRIIDDIGARRPDVVISNVVGSDSTPAFYRQFRAAGYTADTLPIAATVTSEIEVEAMGVESAAGHFMTATYFGSLDNEANRRYVEAIRRRFGPDAVTHVDQANAYNAVWLLALAAQRATGLTAPELRRALPGTVFESSPEGWPVRVHPNHHTEHPAYIGCVRQDGQFEIVAEFSPRAPDAYPALIVPAWKQPAAGVISDATTP